MNSRIILATCAIASFALGLGPRASLPVSASLCPTALEQGSEVLIPLSWSKGSDDGSAVFHLAIYPPWEDASQRAIAFYTGFVTRAGLGGLQANRLSELSASDQVLRAVGEKFECTATLNGVPSWSQVRAKTDVTLTVTPVEE